MKKIIDDTLKNVDGKYSRKSLTWFITLVFGLLVGIYIVISDYFLNKEVNRYAIDVFQTLMLFVAVTLGLTVWDKQIANKNEPKNEE
jgi:uncharacterized protein YacL